MTRAEFLQLTDLDADGFKALGRREQLPFDARDELRPHGQYTPFEAYLTNIALYLGDSLHINRTAAAGIVRGLVPHLLNAWPRIGAYVSDPAAEELLCGRFQPPGMNEPCSFCDTAVGLALQIAAKGPAVSVIGISASRIAAVLATRAAREGITLPAKFWETGGHGAG